MEVPCNGPIHLKEFFQVGDFPNLPQMNSSRGIVFQMKLRILFKVFIWVKTYGISLYLFFFYLVCA